MELSAERVIEELGLIPHPEGGHYRETFRDTLGKDGRSHSTAILYLLREGEISAWHRVDAAELWHWYGGAPFLLKLVDGTMRTELRLGPDWLAGDRPQGLVPPQVWQSAMSLGDWSLMGCTVAPGFEFTAFELAPDGFEP